MIAGIYTRLTAPLIAVSVILLAVGIGAAWYVHDLQHNTTDMVNDHVASVRAAYELEISIRGVRTQFNRYLEDGDRKHLVPVLGMRHRTRYWLQVAERLANTPTEQDLMKRVRAGYQLFFKKYDELTSEPHDRSMSRELKQLIDGVLMTEIVEPVEKYQQLNDVMAARASQANQDMADRLVVGLAGIGVCGAMGGLIVGWLIAASVRRSIELTRERLRNTTEQLNRAAGSQSRSHVPAELDDAMKSMSESVAVVIERLDRSERDALRAEQLAWVGQMAAGIAHEVRNPLMTIKLLVQNAAERRASRPLRDRDLEVVQEEIVRVEQIVSHFLDFARPPRIQKRTVEVQALLQRVTDSLRARAELQEVRLECDVPFEAVYIDADKGQMQQLLFNLVVNALDAQPSGGTVRLCIGTESADAKSHNEMEVRIEDDGPGLPPELGERIFEPFISSKESGMGLGLSICRRIVEAHGGLLSCGNLPAGGAVFTVRLPLAVRIARGEIRIHDAAVEGEVLTTTSATIAQIAR